MKTYVKCAGCRTQSTLKRHPDSYIRIPKCKKCGGTKYWVINPTRTPTCYCSAYHFPHHFGKGNCTIDAPVLGRK